MNSRLLIILAVIFFFCLWAFFPVLAEHKEQIEKAEEQERLKKEKEEKALKDSEKVVNKEDENESDPVCLVHISTVSITFTFIELRMLIFACWA